MCCELHETVVIRMIVILFLLIARKVRSVNMKLNEKIYMLRKKFGWSQDELAERLAVSRQSVSKWETGDNIPESAKLVSLAKVFSVSVDYLLDESQQEYIPLQVKESIDTADKIMSKSESLFKNYGWIFGLIIFLIGLWRIVNVIVSIVTFLGTGAFNVFGAELFLPLVLPVLIGLVFIVVGIIMMKKLKKKKDKKRRKRKDGITLKKCK